MTIDNIIGQLQDAVIEESPPIELKNWALSALKLLPTVGTYIQKIDFFKLENGKVVLPKEVKSINSVIWQHTEPSEPDIKSTGCDTCEPYEYRTHVCKPMVYFSIFLDSQSFVNNYVLLKYIGKDQSLLCNKCPNLSSHCGETFVIDRDNCLYTSIDDGWICINYDTLECDKNGNIVIDDNEVITQFIINYVTYRSLEKRMLSGDSKLASLVDRYKQEKDIWFRKARASTFLRSADLDKLKSLTEGSFSKLLKTSITNVSLR